MIRWVEIQCPRALAGLLFLLATILTILPAAGQMIPAAKNTSSDLVTQAPSPNDLKELSRLLSDPQILEWLRNSASQDQSIDGDDGAGRTSLRDQVDAGMAKIRNQLNEIELAAQMLPQAPRTIMAIWQSRISNSETLRAIAFTVIFVFIGAGLEWLYWQYFTSTRLRMEFRSYSSLRQRINSALMRLILVGVALLVFSLGSIGAFLTFSWMPVVQHVVLSFLISIVIIRVILAGAKFLLAPKAPDLRFVPLSSGPAKRLYRWVGISTIITVFGIMISDTFAFLSNIADAPQSAVSAALAISIFSALTITAVLILAVWRMSKSAGKTRSDAVNMAANNKFRTTPILLTVLIGTSALLWLLGAHEIMWTLIIVALLVPIVAIVNRFVGHLFDQAEGEKLDAAGSQIIDSSQNDDPGAAQEADALDDEEDEDDSGRYDLYRPITIRLSRFAVIITALMILGAVWGVSILSLSTSDTISGKIFGITVDITVALLIADLIWVWAKTAIDRRMADFGDFTSAGGEGGGSGGPEARMATLLPILRKILMITIFVMVCLSVLSSLGINIAPILAGAGVAGIAIGFGAQALVRDIVSGIFFLLDDAFRVGEYIEMGDLRGTVESMSLRSLRVRHHLGAIHTIPFGELKSLTNYSRDWVIMKLEFRVPFDTDIKLVKNLIKQVNTALKADESFGHHLLQPLKSQGVRRMEEFNMVIGVKFMATPGEQWLIRRDAYQRIRDIFTKNGIDFAQRNVKVEVISDQPITPDVEKAVVGAAQEATENKLAAAPAPDEP